MKGIVLAAGVGSRLLPLTANLPKCMLKVYGKSLLGNILEVFERNGVRDISVIRGYKKDKITFQGVSYFENKDFQNNNILHSLMAARKKLEEAVRDGAEVVVSYSDIWYENAVLKRLLEQSHDITAVVDIDWQKYYKGRTDHPVSQAENVIMDEDRRILRIGKNIFPRGVPKQQQGEFIGLWKFSAKGAEKFLKHFDKLNARLAKTEPFQNAKEWQKAYMTDMFQDMIDKGIAMHAALIEKGWAEFDTVQDFERAQGKAPPA